MKKINHGNRRLTVREVAEEVRISNGSCHTILTEDLGMHRVSAKFVPRLLTDDRKLQRFSTCKNFLQRENDENLLKNVITGDETWVYGYGAETKQQFSHWMSPASPRSKKAQQVRSRVKAMLLVFFFDHQGIVRYEFAPKASGN
jgi:histone-lysine N-methyltransferase SETMAR